MISRRQMLLTSLGGAAALALPKWAWADDEAGFSLPKLDYAYDALEPHIDAKTMEIHHARHHQAYVNSLNAALKAEAPNWLDAPLENVAAGWREAPEGIRTAVRNHGGGHLNHSLFWKMMAPEGEGGEPSGDLQRAINETFGDTDGFKKEFLARALGQFGSGWAWLVVGPEKKLEVIGTPNQDSPIMDGKRPVLGVDVWEHAYYLKYQNMRGSYVEAWHNLVNWQFANELYADAVKA